MFARSSRAAMIGAALLTTSTLDFARSAELGDAPSGRRFAEGVCTTCHEIRPKRTTSPVPEATPFQAIADTPGINRTALLVFFRTPHRTMPNLIIAGDDADNVIAYILSLKPGN